MAAPSAIDELLAAAKDRSLPPVERWNPQRVGEIDIRIASNGDWYHEGALIKRVAIAKLFATVLRLEDGQHYLVTPAEKLRIQVDDAPFVAIDMDADGKGSSQRLLFTTNCGDLVLAGADRPITVAGDNGAPRPYVEVRRGLQALIARSVFYRLVALAEVDAGNQMGVWSNGQRFVLGTAVDGDAGD